MKTYWVNLSVAELAHLQSALCLNECVLKGELLIDQVLAEKLDAIAKASGQELLGWLERMSLSDRLSCRILDRCGLPAPVDSGHLRQAEQLLDQLQAKFGADMSEALATAVHDTMEDFGSSLMNGEKMRSTEPMIAHPSGDGRRRLLTPREHARVKGIDPALVAGLSATLAHEILGQSVLAPAWRSIGRMLGQQMRVWLESVPCRVPVEDSI